jgi:CubicO group peptidase (beta-lactamase class C family)
LLSHRAGLPVLDVALTPEQVYAWDPITDALAAQKPVWEPGTKHGYHAVTYGFLVGEVIRRITGTSVGQYLADNVTGPLGAEFYIGLPEAHEARVSRLIEMSLEPTAEQREMFKSLDVNTLPPNMRAIVTAFLDPNSLSLRALTLTKPAMDFNSRAMHAAEVPAANGICTARGLARMYAGLIGDVDGVRILDDATIANAIVEQSNGPDAVLVKDTRFGLGFFLKSDDQPMMGPRSFGHDGAGGSMAFADPDSGLAFGYVMNKMQANLSADPRPVALIDAVKNCL